MLALTWFISVAISLPIAVGMNYTERRSQTPTLCTFYNAEFLIYSSMTSFYIPCVVIVLLYWRIFRAIHSRTRRRSAAATSAQKPHRKLPDIYVVDNHVNAVTTSGAAEKAEVEVEGSVGPWACDDGQVAVDNEAETAAVTECVLSLSSGQDSSNSAAGKADTAQKRRRKTHKKCRTSAPTSRLTNERRIGLRLTRLTRRTARTTDLTVSDNNKCTTSRDKNASRRERKATKTLAIVLGTY